MDVEAGEEGEEADEVGDAGIGGGECCEGECGGGEGEGAEEAHAVRHSKLGPLALHMVPALGYIAFQKELRDGWKVPQP